MNTNPRNQSKVRRKGKLRTTRPLSIPIEILWALIGLLLTIYVTYIEAFVTNAPWKWSEQGFQIYSLHVTYQIGAVLLVGCLGGKNAGALSQIAYIVLGLTCLIGDVFYQGCGWDYIKESSFGYLLGFVPGAWLCGVLAFKTRPKLEFLFVSCISGLIVVHFSGLTYLIGLQLLSPVGQGFSQLFSEIVKYSIIPLPGQIVVICSISVISFFARKLLFY